MYAQCVNSAYTVHNSKICLPKSTNADKKKKKQKMLSRKCGRGAQTATISFSKPIQITQRPDPITVGKPLFFESKELAAIPVRK